MHPLVHLKFVPIVYKRGSKAVVARLGLLWWQDVLRARDCDCKGLWWQDVLHEGL
jgi:hypothetical protein